ncbi:IclR family transcriptional regulator [Kitasatospora sp. NPDC091335]|uniref:IclR family transcriptional regulator n=1 Tax=Kitasatospora sp. NPDC091335 TaxID=3364085 RepID=UPI0037FAEC12
MAGNSGEAGGRSVAGRVFAVLEAFDGERESLRLAEIARQAGLPAPTALRMVRELVAWGALERQRDGGYRLGRRLWALGSLAPCLRRVRELAQPALRDLHERTGQTALVAALDGRSALLLDRLPGAAAPSSPFRVRVGGRMDLHATAVGRVLLAHAPEALVREVTAGLSAAGARHTRDTVVAPGRLARELAAVRRGGVGYARREMQPVYGAAAVPVFHPDGSLLAALGLVVAAPVDPARFEARLREAGRLMTAGVARSVAEEAGQAGQATGSAKGTEGTDRARSTG